jgi:serine/threonine protein kinase
MRKGASGEEKPPRAEIRYEKAKPPGTAIKDYELNRDGLAKREKVNSTVRRTRFGISWQARHSTTGEISWVEESNGASMDLFWRETDIRVRLVHPALLGLVGFVPPVDKTGYLVTEYMPNGSLDELIKDPARYGKLSPTAKAKIAVGIAIGMRYMHAAGVLHRDLKPSNILLDENKEPRIGDLRVARLVSIDPTMTAGVGTSGLYSAPEIVDNHYNEKVDVFSFAMIWWEIVTGKNAMTGFPDGKDPGLIGHLRRIQDGVRPYLNVGVVADGILGALWDTDPDNRLSFSDFLDYAKTNHYELVDGADVNEVARYVSRLEEFEATNPAPNLQEYNEE